MNPKQREVLNYLRKVDQADIHDIYRNVSFSYYCNYEKYIGEICSRLVKANKIIRIKPGVFAINLSKEVLTEILQQQKLF